MRSKIGAYTLLSSPRRKWQGLAMLILIFLCVLIAVQLFLLKQGYAGSTITNVVTFVKKKLQQDRTKSQNLNGVTLEQYTSGRLSPKRFNGTWISDYEFIYRNTFGTVEIYDVRYNNRKVVLSGDRFGEYKVSKYFLSPDRQYLLLAVDLHNVFKGPYLAKFFIYNIREDFVSPVLADSPDVELQHAEWGPIGNQFVYVLDNNIYYHASVVSEKQQVTSDGVKDVIFNGVPDWSFQNNIVIVSHLLWWSDDGKKLLFSTIDDTDVGEIMYTIYGSYNDVKNLYPKNIKMKFAKPGTRVSSLTMWVVDLTDVNRKYMVQPPEELQNKDHFFSSAGWGGNNSAFVQWYDKSLQNSFFSICKESNYWICTTNYKVEAKEQGWLIFRKSVLFTKDRKHYFALVPGPPQGDAGPFRSVAMIDKETGETEFLNEGKYDVVRLLQYNPNQRIVYVMSTLEGRQPERHLLALRDMTHRGPKSVTCLTCDLGPNCLYNNMHLSTDASYYVVECRGPGLPVTYLRSTDSNRLITVLDAYEGLKKTLSKKALPKIKMLKVPIEGGYMANVRLSLPPDLDETGDTKYPVLLRVYGGPEFQLVKHKFSIEWGTYLAGTRNIIYAKIDGRGSGFSGYKFMYEIYHRFGEVEISDQIAVMSYLRDNLSYIDKDRIAVFGWSYGGYASSKILAHDDGGVFQCAIAVGTPASPLYYDAVISESFTGFPEGAGLENYRREDLLHEAPKFKGKKLLLIQGEADENVQMQSFSQFSKALVDAGVLFRMQLYPDQDHALGGVTMHLYRTIDDYLDYCFAQGEYEKTA